MNIEIILRTHDQSNVHTDKERYCGSDKKTLVEKCLISLVNSANLVRGHTINYKILDDHSSNELIDSIYKIMDKSVWSYELFRMSKPGYNYSALKQFEYCKNSGADLVYSVEDDYLHCPMALTHMIDNYIDFKNKTGRETVIYPYDFEGDYRPDAMYPSYIVRGSNGPWRTGFWTTNTFLLRPQLVEEHWPLFYKLATEYNSDYSRPPPHVHEGNTICEIWKNHAVRFSPIPSLALHVQFEQHIDPYVDWQKWWNEYTVLP